MYLGVAIGAAPTLLILVFSVYLTVRLRKKAWNTTSKIFSRFLEINLVVSYLLALVLKILCGLKVEKSCPAAYLNAATYVISSVVITNFCIAVSTTALMLQVMFPWFSERTKRCLESNSAVKCKLTLEILGAIMIVLYNICWMVFDFLDGKYISIVLISSLSYTIALVSLFLQVFSIACLFLFVRVMRLRTRTNHLQLKLFLLGAIAVLGSVFSTTLFIGVSIYLSVLTCIPGKYCVLIILITYFVSIYVYVTVVTALSYPRETWCCCKRRSLNSNIRTPLLVNNATEGQETHPASVWDHRNDPSGTTATHYRAEMTDCRSDYQQLP